MSESFYHTIAIYNSLASNGYAKGRCLSNAFVDLLMQGMRPSGVIRGCVAVKAERGGFVISKRAKWDIGQFVFVSNVDHLSRTVSVVGGRKASLNAPLIDWIFKKVPWSHAVIHWHGEVTKVHSICPALKYYDPGSIKDSQRDLWFLTDGNIRDFYIMDHGFFKILSEEECSLLLK
jgi:hypothetical protein